MLYVTTRNDRDTFTARRTLTEFRGPDGGLYVPFREPCFSEGEIRALKEKSFNQCVAEMLNLLFSARLTQYDVGLAIGRYSVRLNKLSQRVFLAETWHNLDSNFQQTVENLTKLLCPEGNRETESGSWVDIGVRIAVLFGIFSELMGQGILEGDGKIDISTVSGNFADPISAWYARRWGLPIGNIICCCNENSTLWDFICHGTLRTGDVAVPTVIPEADIVVPVNLERLIYGCAGTEETLRYLDTLRRAGTYYLDDLLLQRLRQGIYVTVSSHQRILSTIPRIYSSHNYLFSPSTALAYVGLQDYRSRTGQTRTALVMAHRSASLDADTVASALGVSGDAVLRIDQ